MTTPPIDAPTPPLGNRNHLETILDSTEAWNNWRLTRPEEIADLRGFDVSGALRSLKSAKPTNPIPPPSVLLRRLRHLGLTPRACFWSCYRAVRTQDVHPQFFTNYSATTGLMSQRTRFDY